MADYRGYKSNVSGADVLLCCYRAYAGCNGFFVSAGERFPPDERSYLETTASRAAVAIAREATNRAELFGNEKERYLSCPRF